MSTPATSMVLTPLIPKLRASCDACANSKVKCDKEQPACRRCLSSGIECVYGVSRKHGKQPRQRRSTAPDGRSPMQSLAPRAMEEALSSRSGPFPPDVDLGFDGLLHDLGMPSGMSVMGCHEQELYNLPTPESPIPDDEWSSLVGPNPFFSDFRSPNSRRPPFRSHYSTHSSYDKGSIESPEDARFARERFPMPSSGTPSTYSPRLAPGSRGTPVTEGGCWRPSTMDNHQHHNHHHHRANSAVSSASPHPQQSPRSCYNLAASALETLRLETRYGCTKKRTHDGPGASTLPILNLDHILEANKSALATLQQTLDCKCAERHAPLVFLYASILSKVIFWYQVAGRIIRSAAAPTNGPGRFASTTNSALPEHCLHGRGSPTADSFSARSLESLPVSIGGFDIDPEDRATLSQHLLLSELRKAAGLVERLQARRGDSEHDSMSGFSRDGGGGNTRDLYGMLSSWLKGELTRTIREVQSISDASDRSAADQADRRRLPLDMHV